MVFVDDIAGAFEFEDIEGALVSGREQSERVSLALGDIGMSQNQAKQESLPICCGTGAYRTEARLQEGCGLDGMVLLAARYLGVRLTARFTFGVERSFRLQAGRQAWACLSCFWTSDVPLARKRHVLRGQVTLRSCLGLNRWPVKMRLSKKPTWRLWRVSLLDVHESCVEAWLSGGRMELFGHSPIYMSCARSANRLFLLSSGSGGCGGCSLCWKPRRMRSRRWPFSAAL